MKHEDLILVALSGIVYLLCMGSLCGRTQLFICTSAWDALCKVESAWDALGEVVESEHVLQSCSTIALRRATPKCRSAQIS